MMHRFGWRSWDFDPTPIELEEAAAALKPGRALGLGCRSGRQAVELAKLGWNVTVLDDDASAVALARRNASAANVEVTFQISNVASPEGFELKGEFDLLFDIRSFQQVPIESRPDYERNVSRAAREGAAYVLFAVPPSFLWRLIASGKGVELADVESLFGTDFQLVSQRAVHDWPFAPVCYQLRRHTRPRSDALHSRSVV
jgi:SAM-dependent methyltransferase